jgi:lauroyl/myristoyl acyltransferase
LPSGYRKIAEANYDIVFPNPPDPGHRKRILAASYRNMALTILDTIWSERIGPDNFQKFIRVNAADLAEILKQREEGIPQIFALAHHGNWEMAASACRYIPLPLDIVVHHIRNPHIREFLNRQRQGGIHRTITAKESARPILKGLTQGRIACLVIDQNIKPIHGGSWVEFFGLPVTMSRAISVLGARTGAAVHGIQCVADSHGVYDLGVVWRDRAHPASRHNRDAEKDEMDRLMDQTVGFLHQLIERYPEQWAWTYKRWKYQYPGRESEYPFYSKPLTWEGQERHHKMMPS